MLREAAVPPDEPPPVSPQRTWPRFRALFGIGLIGVASLPLVTVPLLRIAPPPGPAAVRALPLPALVILTLVNPASFLALGVWIGIRCAPAVGLTSFVDDRVRVGLSVWPRLRPHVPVAVVCGLVLAVLTVFLDAALSPRLGRAWAIAASRAPAGITPGSPRTAVVGVMYGGLAEEIMLRWGALSGFAWLWWRARGRPVGGTGRFALPAATLASAVLFGLGHLPAVAHVSGLTPLLILRTVGLNAMAGLAFGWLFCRRGLETAMVAHATAHVALNGIAVLLRA